MDNTIMDEMVKRESELGKLLADERLRAEQHKVNYQLLKAEHCRLNDEYKKLQLKVQDNNMPDSKALTAGDNSLIKNMEKKLIEANLIIKKLHSQIPNPLQIEALQNSIRKEIFKQYSNVMKSTEEEIYKSKEKYQTLAYEFAAFKTTSEHINMNLELQMKEIEMRHAAEIIHLKKSSQELEKNMSDRKAQEFEKLKKLEGENIHLKKQCELLELEMKEVGQGERGAKEELEKHRKSFAVKITELNSHLKLAQLEQSALKAENQRLNNELEKLSEENSTLKLNITESKGQASQLHFRLCDVEQKYKLLTVDHQLQLKKEQEEREIECENFNRLFKDLKLELEICKKKNADEEEIIMQLKSIQLQENSSTSAIQKELAALQNQLLALKSQLVEKDEKYHALRKKYSKLSRLLLESRKKEGKLRSQETANQQLIEKLQKDMKLILEGEEALLLKNKEINSTLRTVQKKFTKKLSTGGLNKLSKLKKKNSKLRRKLNCTSTSSKYKIKTYRRLIIKLRNKLKVQEAEMEKLSIEKDSLKCGVPLEVHNLLKKQLRDLQRRREEFHKALYLNENSPFFNHTKKGFSTAF